MDKQNDESFKKIKGTLYYQTNDFVQIKNKLYYVKGKNDNIVKIQGYRVELLEIESVIRTLKNVNGCYVFVLNLSNYEKIICAAIETSSLKISKIEKHLRKFFT